MMLKSTRMLLRVNLVMLTVAVGCSILVSLPEFRGAAPFDLPHVTVYVLVFLQGVLVSLSIPSEIKPLLGWIAAINVANFGIVYAGAIWAMSVTGYPTDLIVGMVSPGVITYLFIVVALQCVGVATVGLLFAHG